MNRFPRVCCGAGGRRRARARGYSLAELATIISIITILSMVALPRMTASVSRQRGESAAKRVAADIAAARERAIRLSTAQTVRFSPSTDAYSVVNEVSLDPGKGSYTVDVGAEPYRADLLTATDSGSSADLVFDGFGVPANPPFSVRVSPDGGTRVWVVTVDESGGTTVAKEP